MKPEEMMTVQNPICKKCGGELSFAEYPQMGSNMNELEVIMDCVECIEQYFGHYKLERLEVIVHDDN